MPWHPQTWRWHWWDYTCYHVLQSDTSASTFYNVIMPSTPTPPTFTLHLIFDWLFSLSIFSFFLVYFSSLFSIDFSHSGPDGQIDLKRSYVYPGCRLCASGICPIPCTHPLPKSLSRTSVKMAFLVARIGAQKGPCVHLFQKWPLHASVFRVTKTQHLDPKLWFNTDFLQQRMALAADTMRVQVAWGKVPVDCISPHYLG